MIRKSLTALVFLVLALGAEVARAEHEVYYRYTVLGYVKDRSGVPQGGVPVELVREKTGFSYLGRTDDKGFYVITARIGDESVGERLRLRAGHRAVTIAVRFEPADHVRERGTRVDFIGDRSVETAAAFGATLQGFLSR